MDPLVAVTLAPLGVVVLVLVVVFIGLVVIDRWQRAAQQRDEDAGDVPLPDTAPFASLSDEHLLAKADGGLLNADDERLARAAAELDDRGHPKAVAYLLHTLRRAPEHREALLARLRAHPREDLKRHSDLVRALAPEDRERLRTVPAARSHPEPDEEPSGS